MNIEEQKLERTRQNSSLVELSKDVPLLEETERNSSLANCEKNDNRNEVEKQDKEKTNSLLCNKRLKNSL